MKRKILGLLVAASIVAACNYPAPGADVDQGAAAPRAWIDRPLEGSEFLLGDVIPIQWHASGDDGVRQVEIRINGNVLAVDDSIDPYLLLVEGETDWNPAETGEYLIQVIATGPDEAEGSPAENRVTVFAEGGSIVGAVYADLNQDGDSDDPDEGPLAAASVVVAECGEKRSLITGEDGAFQFTDLPNGFCVMDVSLAGWSFSGTFPAGIDFPIHFQPNPGDPIILSVFLSRLPTPPPTAMPPTFTVPPPTAMPPTFTLPPPTTPPTQPPDTTGPPAPDIIMPAGNPTLPCPPNVKLAWSAPSDPSGIANYRVALQVKTTDWNTQKIWDPVTSTQVTASSELTCGGVYRWRVLARDGAGNQGQFSEWAYFGVTLP